MTIADYIITVLRSRGVRQVFGYPGAVILPLMEAIEREPEMQWVLMRHEGSAALAACAAAKLDGRLAVCCASAGPGATNMVTGLLDAHLDRAPVLALTGMLPTWKQNRSGFQDVDQARLLSPLLSSSFSIGHPDQVPGMLRDAVGHAEQAREVAHLAIPVDVQQTEIPAAAGHFVPGEAPEALRLHPPPPESFDLVAESLRSLQRALIVAGPRARGCGAAIEALAERLRAPIISTLDAKGVIDESHPCALGVLGIFGAPGAAAAREVLSGADGILAFGIDNVAAFVTDQAGTQCRALYQFEPDFSSLTHRLRRTRTLVGPLDQIAEGLSARLATRRAEGLLDTAHALREQLSSEIAASAPPLGCVHPVAVMRALAARLASGDTIALDVGDSTVWAAKFLELRGRQDVLVSNQLGTMGFCLPAVVAAGLVRPQGRVLGICGDGSFQMAMGELMAAVQYRIGAVIVVFQNGMLQRVAAQQSRAAGTRIETPDFVALAEACGCEGARVSEADALEAALDRAFAVRERPFLLECRIGEQTKAPMSGWDSDYTPMNFA